MKATFLIASMAALLSLTCARGDDPPKKLQFQVKILQGDPLGSREEGTLEFLCNSTAVTWKSGALGYSPAKSCRC